MRRTSFAVLAVVALGAVGCGNPFPKPPPKATTPAEPTVDERNTSRPAESVVGQVYRAGKRSGLLQEMQQIGGTISVTVQLDERMPTAADIKADLQKSAAKYAALIDDGTIVLTDTKNTKGLWAYEVDADKAGGIVLVGGQARRATADEVKHLIAAK